MHVTIKEYRGGGQGDGHREFPGPDDTEPGGEGWFKRTGPDHSKYRFSHVEEYESLTVWVYNYTGEDDPFKRDD